MASTSSIPPSSSSSSSIRERGKGSTPARKQTEPQTVSAVLKMSRSSSLQENGSISAVSSPAIISPLQLQPEPEPALSLVWRMNKETYLEWVSHHVPGSIRLFHSDFIERLSLTPFWLVPLVHLPIAAVLITYYLSSQPFGAPGYTRLIRLLIQGVALWTVLEYTLHRFVFHLDEWLPDHPLALCFSFLSHGVHHRAPNDALRLVMPPIVSIPAAALIATFFRFTFFTAATMSLPNFAVFFAGGILGYIMYELCHFSLHHLGVEAEEAAHAGGRGGDGLIVHIAFFGLVSKVFEALKNIHHRHHVRGNVSYGVTSPFWDYVFLTAPDSPNIRGWGRSLLALIIPSRGPVNAGQGSTRVAATTGRRNAVVPPAPPLVVQNGVGVGVGGGVASFAISSPPVSKGTKSNGTKAE